MSISGGVDGALERGASIGCESVQIFLKSNMQWTGKPISDEEAARFRHGLKRIAIRLVFAHSCYLVNLGATDPATLKKSIAAMVDEIERAGKIGVPFIVMHPGSHLGAGEAAGLKRVAKSLDQVFARAGAKNVGIALETTAGQGTNLGHRLEHLSDIIGMVTSPARVGVCVDTCHVFAAGYDIRTVEGYGQLVGDIIRTVGLERVWAYHLNDSKTPLGSRVDRHAHIGKGHIGLDGFRHVLRDKRWRKLPMVLETPKSDDMHEDVENLRVLRRLLSMRPAAGLRGRAQEGV
jgi:deoxyribonuclease-4